MRRWLPLYDTYLPPSPISQCLRAAEKHPPTNSRTDALGGYRIQNRESYGVELSLLASAVLGGSAIPRAIRLRKPVPIGLSVLSLFGLLTFGREFSRSL